MYRDNQNKDGLEWECSCSYPCVYVISDWYDKRDNEVRRLPDENGNPRSSHIASHEYTLLKARNHGELDDELLQEYHSSLQANESSLYPDIRKTYLKEAHKNLLCIMKAEQVYYDNIQKVNNGEKMTLKCDSQSDTSSETTDNIIIHTPSLDVVDEMDTSNRPDTKRELPLIKEDVMEKL